MQRPEHEVLSSGLTALGLDLPDATQQKLLAYMTLIAKWNRVYNLTAVRDANDMLTLHLLDSLAVVASFRAWLQDRPAPRLLDVGSGAGLPGIVLSIVEPAWHVTCVDTVGKKASFIQQVAAELKLPNLTSVHARVEAMVAPPFDIVTSRAFASLVDFTQWTTRHLAAGGVWAAMKAKLPGDERATLPSSIDVFHVEQLAVPGLDADRCLVWMRPAA